MKIYEMIDEENGISIGVLLYYENSREFIIELKEELDEWTAPVLFSGYVIKNIYTIPRSAGHMWVSERVVPLDRQNIGSILATHKLASYDEMKLLEISHGRCSQDSIYIRKADKLPDYAAARAKHNATECIVSSDRYLICFFADEVCLLCLLFGPLIHHLLQEAIQRFDLFCVVQKKYQLESHGFSVY